MDSAAPKELILASSSVYRGEALRTLGLAFRQQSPNIDEAARPGEHPLQLVWRLTQAKAQHIQALNPHAWIIAGDQIGICNNEILTKPGTPLRAVQQLQRMRGQQQVFYSGLCVAAPGRLQTTIVPTRLRMRNLSDAELEAYVAADNPVDCAGSFKAERQGIRLFHSIRSADPSALVGLPLIALTTMLQRLSEAT
ncbi:MAG: nucleoside triphosphate pyrophosphatase [Pseudomonadota bacterium]